MSDIVEIFKNFRFEAAHRFPKVPKGHPCSGLHGHSFRVRIYATGPIDEEAGWLVDFAEIKYAFEPILKELDHSFLNEIPGLENPTSENIARWIWQKLRARLPCLSGVLVRETRTSGAFYRGQQG